LDEDEELFWGSEPAESKKPASEPAAIATSEEDDLFWKEEQPKAEEPTKKQTKAKGKKSAANAWAKAPVIIPDPVQQPAPKSKKAQPQKPNAWGVVPKTSAKRLDEIMEEDKVESARRERERERELEQQRQKEAERRAQNAWGMVATPSGSSSLSMTEENFPSLGGGSSSSGKKAATKATTRTQPGNGGLTYSRAVGQVAPTVSRHEDFPPLGA